jgi:prophage DNA circulation protein
MIDDNDDGESPIDRALNLGPINQTYGKTISSIISQARDDSADEDFTFARANIREVIENGTDAIAKLTIIAQQSQNPRAYEVLAKLMDTITNASKELLELQEKIRTIDKADVPRNEDSKNQVTNNLFVGSTHELQKMIENMRNRGPS